jgi:hypothetical protein
MESEELKPIPVFFILGRPRSGTTLLRTLFDAHPNVKIPPEFPIILPLYQKFKNVKDWDRETILQFVDLIFKNKAFNNRTLENLHIDREAYTNYLLTLEHRGTTEDFLKSFNYFSYSMFPKTEITRIGDKNPVYSIFAKRFLKIFPESKFICIIRDYRDNYISMKGLAELQMEAPVLSLQVTRWRYAAKLFLELQERYPDRFRVIRYEDLVSDQETVMRNLCAHLGIPFDPEVFDFFKKKEESLSTYPKELVEKYHKSLMNPINKGRMNIWKTELTPKQVKLADQVAGKYADILGYEREYRKFNLWIYLKTRPMAIYSWFIFKLMVGGTYLPYRLSSWLSVNLLVLVKTYHFFFGTKTNPVQERK